MNTSLNTLARTPVLRNTDGDLLNLVVRPNPRDDAFAAVLEDYKDKTLRAYLKRLCERASQVALHRHMLDSLRGLCRYAARRQAVLLAWHRFGHYVHHVHELQQLKQWRRQYLQWRIRAPP